MLTDCIPYSHSPLPVHPFPSSHTSIPPFLYTYSPIPKLECATFKSVMSKVCVHATSSSPIPYLLQIFSDVPVVPPSNNKTPLPSATIERPPPLPDKPPPVRPTTTSNSSEPPPIPSHSKPGNSSEPNENGNLELALCTYI